MSARQATIEAADELYEKSIRHLTAPQRLRLATRILTDIQPQTVVDFEDEWSDEDLKNLTLSSLRRFDEEHCEEVVA